MRLLVSVRSAGEAEEALAGGADIVDAKEPSSGSLGAVAPATLRRIAAAVPSAIPLTVALGDFARADLSAAAVTAVPSLPRRLAPIYFKLGFAGAALRDVERILAAALESASIRDDRPLLVAAAYADHEEAHAPAPGVVTEIAARLGLAGVLIDTHAKDGRTLLHAMDQVQLRNWVAGARHAGLVTALAGSLTGRTLEEVARCGADVIGVRGAACDGGRDGVLRAGLVREVRRLICSRSHTLAVPV